MKNFKRYENIRLNLLAIVRSWLRDCYSRYIWLSIKPKYSIVAILKSMDFGLPTFAISGHFVAATSASKSVSKLIPVLVIV